MPPSEGERRRNAIKVPLQIYGCAARRLSPRRFPSNPALTLFPTSLRGPLWRLYCRWKICYNACTPNTCGPVPNGSFCKRKRRRTSGGVRDLRSFLATHQALVSPYRMLDEARRRHERGEDVVVAAIQPQQSDDLQALVQKLELVPPLQTPEGQAIDVEAVVRRSPQVCVIDPLAATNPPGWRNPHRWQDVQELLRNGISVLTSVNLLHIEEYKEKVKAITGKDTAETIPKSILLAADDIVIVDVPTDVCLWRLGGKLTSIGISNSQERQFSELRELALLLTAELVDAQLESYVDSTESSRSSGHKSDSWSA